MIQFRAGDQARGLLIPFELMSSCQTGWSILFDEFRSSFRLESPRYPPSSGGSVLTSSGTDGNEDEEEERREREQKEANGKPERAGERT